MKLIYNEKQQQEVAQAFAKLYAIIATLRSPQGCPWDLAQTPETLHPHLLEEAYELLDGVRKHDTDNILEELGDVFLVNSMITYIFEEQGMLTTAQVVNGLTDKLIRRHPHVFGDIKANNAEEGHASWIAAKAKEKLAKGQNADLGSLHGVGRGLPPLERSVKIQDKVSKKGFAWQETATVLAKIHEEMQELQQEIDKGDMVALQSELGDVLFTLVGLARSLGLRPEEALHMANEKAIGRFHFVEQAMNDEGLELHEDNRVAMEQAWQMAKKSGL
jgi:tetrapyrrole methylase family protein/MazG family protein